MSKKITSFFSLSPLVFIFFLFTCCKSESSSNSSCPPSVCGNVKHISFPFRLKGDSRNCGHSRFELDCQNNHTIITFNSKKFYVQSIVYNNFTIRVVDPGLINPAINCSFPNNSAIFKDDISNHTYGSFLEYNHLVAFISCIDPISKSSRYVDISFCKAGNFSRDYRYVGIVNNVRLSDLPESCGVEKVAAMSANGSLMDIHQGLAYGFELSWYHGLCDQFPPFLGCACSFEGNTVNIRCLFKYYALFIRHILPSLPVVPTLVVFIKFLCGIGLLTGLLIQKWRRRHLSADQTIEDFLQVQTNLLPIKYNYSDIKKMTNNFKHKLGEGGYGIVYRGKLRSGSLVAVKMMNKSISNEQQFSNEISTIGRIHHVNVVQLIGFCHLGSKHALVYEYMPKGSLDKYISLSSFSTPLTYKNMFDISLGIARGIDYLHTGGVMQILHFDIKPHNILLDDNFNPKISDFGLAQLYPTGLNTVTFPTTARGTMGYMAPELFYNNIGGVSYKADVYSFGMLLIELASRKENIHPLDECDEQIYFPSWVYDQFYEGKEIEMGNVSDEEKMMVKKMIKVALWCIQMKPGHRPSMNKVVEMLERESDEAVAMPPRPFIAQLGTPHKHGISALQTTQT